MCPPSTFLDQPLITQAGFVQRWVRWGCGRRGVRGRGMREEGSDGGVGERGSEKGLQNWLRI